LCGNIRDNAAELLKVCCNTRAAGGITIGYSLSAFTLLIAHTALR
jgi:hypothetical protein